MKALKLALSLFLLLPLSPALASWHYNEDGGFGIYQPEGWSVAHNGRSSRLTGPATDTSQSDIFLGSDWVSHIASQDDLARYVRQESGTDDLAAATISELKGFRVGSAERGAIYLLRTPNNVIVIEFDLRGSPAQISEGLTMLGSIEIRTRGNENQGHD